MGYHLIPVALLLAAAVAWDQFIPSWKNLKILLVLPVILFFVMDFCLYADNFPLGTKNLQLFFDSCRSAVLKLAVYGGLLGIAAIISLVFRSRAQRLDPRWRALGSFRALATAALLTGLLVDVFPRSYQSGLPANQYRESYREPPKTTWLPESKSSPAYQAGYVHPLTWQAERREQPEEARQQVVLGTPAYFYTYAYAQFDPCWPGLQPFGAGIEMQKLLALRDKNDPALRTILGCHAPKLRLMTQALYVNSEAEAEEAVGSHDDLVNVAILQLPSNVPRPSMPHSAPAGNPGSVQVTDFGANAIEIHVNVTVPEGAWLVYADTYDPRWRAWVNGKPVPVVPAYVGLKAVWVPHGDSVVRMKFTAWSNVGVRVLAIGGAVCSLALILYCGICCIRGFPSFGRKPADL